MAYFPRVARDIGYMDIAEHLNSFTTKGSIVSKSVYYQYPTPKVEINSLPQWIQDYVAWHRQVRKQFPGRKLLEDTNAPGLLIRTCSASDRCGGLNDRLGKLPWDLYLANQTKRVLLIHWCKPYPLQEYLLPNMIDWTIPQDYKGEDDMVSKLFGAMDKCSGVINRWKDMFHGLKANRPRPSFWATGLDVGLKRAMTGEFHREKLLKFQILGDEVNLQDRLKALGESDMLVDWLDHRTFGRLFWLFFRPSEMVQKQLDATYERLQIRPYSYSAVHCRVRHPKATKVLLSPKDRSKGGPDISGLSWSGQSREFAIKTANRAMRCLISSSDTARELPMYFYSDSEDLVNYVSYELTSANPKVGSTLIELEIKEAMKDNNVLRRSVDNETLHIDRQVYGQPAVSFVPSFVDFLVAAQARCVSLGVGNYALFAAKLSSGTSPYPPCVVQYQGEEWGDEGTKKGVIKQCHLGNPT